MKKLNTYLRRSTIVKLEGAYVALFICDADGVVCREEDVAYPMIKNHDAVAPIEIPTLFRLDLDGYSFLVWVESKSNTFHLYPITTRSTDTIYRIPQTVPVVTDLDFEEINGFSFRDYDPDNFDEEDWGNTAGGDDLTYADIRAIYDRFEYLLCGEDFLQEHNVIFKNKETR